MNDARCPNCDSLLISLYYRDNQKDKRIWVKVGDSKFCKKCKKVKDITI